MRWMITDFKRGVTEPTFIGSILISLIILIISLIYYLITHESYEATQAFIVSQSLVLPFIAPLLAALPFSNMSMLEEDSGYKKLLLFKQNKSSYDHKRWLSNGIIGGLAIIFPLFILLGVCRVFSPYNDIEQIGGVLLLDFFFGFGYASIAYGLTFVNTKRYIPLVGPQVIYFLLIYALPYLKLETYYPPLSFSPWILPSKVNGENIILQLLFLLAGSLLLMWMSKIYFYIRERVS